MNRICLVVHSLGIGGMERVMSLLANNFAERENTEVHLVLIGIKRKISYPLRDSVVVHRPEFTFNNSRRTADTIRTMKFLRSVVKTIDPDTVLSFGEMWNNLVLLSLFGLHYPIYVSDRSQPDKNLGRLHNYLRDKLYPLAEGYIAQTDKAKEICLENSWNSNVEVIGNPVREINKDPAVRKENIILTVGRLIISKNIDHLIEMFAEIDHPDWKLVIVGGDAKKLHLSKDLNELIKKLGMEQKIFLKGNQKNVDSFYNRSKIFAFTSSSEGFPNVVAEALSAGLPIVAYDSVPGLMELVEDGVNGFLSPILNKDQFVEKLKMLMESKKLREKFSQNSASKILKFEENEISDKYIDFITACNNSNSTCK